VRLRFNRFFLFVGIGGYALLVVGLALIFPTVGASASLSFLLGGVGAVNALMGMYYEVTYRRQLEMLLTDRIGGALAPPFDPRRDL
jgi:hypothetical protein